MLLTYLFSLLTVAVNNTQPSAVDEPPLDCNQFSAVPTTIDDVTPLIDRALDVCWQCRRYGESLDSILPPQSYFRDDEESADTLETVSCRTFKRLVFDLVAEIMQEIYYEDDHVELAPWCGPFPVRPRRFPIGSDKIPTTVESVRPIVCDHVLRCLGMTPLDRTLSKSKKWLLGTRVNTAVDHVLVEELCLEEPDWVHYDVDVTTRKLQIADFLVDALIYDTTQTLMAVERTRRARTADVCSSTSSFT